MRDIVTQPPARIAVWSAAGLIWALATGAAALAARADQPRPALLFAAVATATTIQLALMARRARRPRPTR